MGLFGLLVFWARRTVFCFFFVSLLFSGLKIQTLRYKGTSAACQLHLRCTTHPWVVLSAGTDIKL